MLDSKKAKRLGKFFTNQVAQTKDEKMKMVKKLRMVPVIHACGDHSLCAADKGNWSHTIRAKEKKTLYHGGCEFHL